MWSLLRFSPRTTLGEYRNTSESINEKTAGKLAVFCILQERSIYEAERRDLKYAPHGGAWQYFVGHIAGILYLQKYIPPVPTKPGASSVKTYAFIEYTHILVFQTPTPYKKGAGVLHIKGKKFYKTR